MIIINGEIDLANAPQLELCIDGVVGLTKGAVVIDLANVGYIDSTGLSILLTAHEQLGDAARTLIIRNPSSQVRRLLELCGVNHLNLSPTHPPGRPPEDHADRKTAEPPTP